MNYKEWFKSETSMLKKIGIELKEFK